jgi:hypothetical protein
MCPWDIAYTFGLSWSNQFTFGPVHNNFTFRYADDVDTLRGARLVWEDKFQRKELLVDRSMWRRLRRVPVRGHH